MGKRELNLAHCLDLETLEAKKNQIKKIFFYRVCGTGMGACACLLKQKGYEVEGADRVFAPPMSDYLNEVGIACHELDGLNLEKLKEFDLIIVGNVVARESDDARMIESLGVDFTSFPRALGALLLKDYHVVGLSGTHGKTTTTYYMAQMFKAMGEDPGYFIGGVLPQKMSSYLGDGKYFFIESDEYDSAYFDKISKFRSYQIDSLILTSLEFDHADIFNSLEDIENEFHALLPNVKESLIVCSDYEAGKRIFEKYCDKVKFSTYYGDASNGPINITSTQEGSSFDLMWKNEKIKFNTNIVGTHNLYNIVSCIYFALSRGYSISEVQSSILNLDHVKRRQELRGTYKKSPVIDDFAHHPRAIKETLMALKLKYPEQELVVVVEPNSATGRSDLFQAEYPASLIDADFLIMARPNKSTTVNQAKDLDCEALVAKWNQLKCSKHNAQVVEDLISLRSALDFHAGPNRVIIILSNGTCIGLWSSDFVNELDT